MRVQIRRPLVLVVLCAAVSPLATGTVEAQGGAVVTPGDQDGLYDAPSVDLGALAPGSSGSPGTPDSGSDDDTANGDQPGVAIPPGLSWTSPEGSAFPIQPQFGIPDLFPEPPQAPTPAALAQQAVQQLVLPLPTPQHSPDLRLGDGRQATVVGEHTWFWTSPSDWHRQSQRVEAGPVWAEVTAEPTELSLQPGNGQAAVSCAGPGTEYDPSFGMHAASPDCDLVYERSSVDQSGEQVTGVWSVTWRVSWTGFNGAEPVGGVLPEMTSRSHDTFAVVEAQALGTH